MRQELNDLEMIEKYLNKELGDEEAKAFEQRLLNEPGLKEMLECQRIIYSALQRNAIREEVLLAGKNYRTGFRRWKWGFVAATALIVSTTVVFYYTKSDTQEMGDPTKTTNDEFIATPSPVALPCVAPPLQDLDPGYLKIKAEASKGIDFVYEKTGSAIHVPANAFVDKNGNRTSGEIEIRYREFRDPFEIMLAGIPMHYDTAGTHEQLVSDGMIELRAFDREGEELRMAADAKIGVDMRTKKGETDFNLYFLDEQKNNWEHMGKDVVSVFNEAEEKGEGQGRLEQSNNPGFGAGLANTEKKRARFGIKNLNSSNKTSGADYSFEFYDISSLQPDMKPFEELSWNYFKGKQGKVSQKNAEGIEQILKLDSKDGLFVFRYWDLVMVNYSAPAEYLDFTFIGEYAKYNDIKVKLYPGNMGKYRNRPASWLYKEHLRLKDSITRARLAKSLEDVNAVNVKHKNKAYIIRSFFLTTMGIWNIDKIINKDEFDSFVPEFVTEQGEHIAPSEVFYLTDKYNTVIALSGTKVKYIPKANNLYVLMIEGDKVAIVEPARFRHIKKGAQTQRLVVKVMDNPKTIAKEIERSRSELIGMGGS